MMTGVKCPKCGAEVSITVLWDNHRKVNCNNCNLSIYISKSVSTTVTEDIALKIKYKAETENISVSEIVRDAIISNLT